MGLSIITPHYNDLDGLQRVYKCLKTQSSIEWEWIIVDDASAKPILNSIEIWSQSLSDKRIKLIINRNKTNGSVCRNIGADLAQYNHLVFLDADDYISKDFVLNRRIDFVDFAVFKNTAVVNKEHVRNVIQDVSCQYLNYFLKAQFIWPITSVLWKKEFFNLIGQFHTELVRLQDVELSIRALQKSTKYIVLDNSVDFYYRVKPIRERKNFVKPVCDSVHLFISELLDSSSLNAYQLSLISGYYYLCVKYFVRSGSCKDVGLVERNLNLFYKKRYIRIVDYIIGFGVLKLHKWQIISSNLFLRISRYVFKPKKIIFF